METKLEVTYVGNLPLVASDRVRLIESDIDYVHICRAVARQELTSKEQKVWVREKIHYVWLKDFFAQLGLSPLFSEKTARDVLAEHLHVRLPEWLTDGEVIEQGLLDIVPDEEFSEICNLEDRLLALFSDEVFYKSNFEPKRMSEIVAALATDEAETAFERYPALQQALTEKCTQWAERSDKEWVRRICDMLPENIQRVLQCITAAAYLRGYPERLLEYVLAPEDVQVAKHIPQDIALSAPDHNQTKDQALTQIRAFFRDMRSQIRAKEDFRKLLEFTSGGLSEELDLVIDLFSSGVYTPDEADVRAVYARFESTPKVSARVLETLTYYTRLERPSIDAAASHWSADEWNRWMVESYLPYRSYQLFHQKYDEELEGMAARFSDWYRDEYIQIQSDTQQSLVHSLFQSMPHGDTPVIYVVVMIDCLPVNFFGLAESALKNIGLYRRDLSYRFAALPTTTEYNKAAVCAGRHDVETRDYRALLERRSQEDWNGARVHYAGTLKDLSELRLAKESTVVVVNFIEGDAVLHSDVESMNSRYEDELSRYFTRLADALETALHGWPGKKSDVTVHLLTDHGATRVLNEEKMTFDSQAVQKLFSEEKYRNAKVAKEKVKTIPENLWNIGYKFSNPFIEEDIVHFLPRGHNTVKKTSNKTGYMHGGLSPEEVIVPTAVYKFSKIQWKQPAVRFPELKFTGAEGRAKFYIKRVIPITIEMQNLNEALIEVRRIEVISPEADVKHVDTAKIAANESATVKVHCYFYESALDSDKIELKIRYEIAGEILEFPVELKSEFKSALSGGLNLRDL